VALAQYPPNLTPALLGLMGLAPAVRAPTRPARAVPARPVAP